KWNDLLGADVHLALATDVGRGPGEEVIGGGVGGNGAELAFPAGEEPIGHGEGDGVVGIGNGIAIYFAQNSVYIADGGGLAGAFNEFDTGRDGRVGRDTVQEAELIDAE